MVEIQEVYKDEEDVLLLSHSVTPTRDSVSVLHDYAQAKGVIPGKWHLLTGDKETIYNLGRKSYFVEESLGVDRTTDEFLHTENFVLVDKKGHLRGIYNGLSKASLERMKEDIQTLRSKG
jgi:protein SCO1/2